MQTLLPATDRAIAMPKVQHPPSGPLAPSGLSDEWSKGYNTYFSHVKLGPQKTLDQFYKYVNNAMTQNLAGLVKSGDIILHIIAVIFGAADVEIVWQARDDNAAKEFRKHILAGNGHSSSETFCALSADGHDG